MPSAADPGRFDRAWALVFARLVLGLIFFMAGVHKVFVQGALEHARQWFLPFGAPTTGSRSIG